MSKKKKDIQEEKKQDIPVVAMIEDPYGINTPEISEAQQNGEELDLDHDLRDIEVDIPEQAPSEVDESQLKSLAQALAEIEEEEKAIDEIDEEQEAQDAAEKLAEQIAEDQALAQELAKEAEEEMEKDPELAAALPKEPQPDESGNLDLAEMESCLEALLFMMDRPVSVQKLRELLGPDFKMNVFQEALTSLRDRYKTSHHGIEIVEVAGGYQFRTKPGRAALAKKLAKIQTQKLSTGAMETLAIVAYKQPVMKDDVDKIRGVDSSYFVHGLLEKKLIKITGRSELPGRPMLYATTDDFLELFGLKDLSSMPSLRELEQMVPESQSANPDEDDPRVKEMRRLVAQMKADKSGALKYDPREDEKILKEIRERVQSIPSSTPTLDQQKEAEKLAAQGLTASAEPQVLQPELPVAESAAPATEQSEVQMPEIILPEAAAAADEASTETPAQ